MRDKAPFKENVDKWYVIFELRLEIKVEYLNLNALFRVKRSLQFGLHTKWYVDAKNAFSDYKIAMRKSGEIVSSPKITN